MIRSALLRVSPTPFIFIWPKRNSPGNICFCYHPDRPDPREWTVWSRRSDPLAESSFVIRGNTQSVHPLPPTSTGTWVSHFLWHGTPAHLFEWQRRYRGVRKQISQPRSQRGLKQCTQADESAEQKYVLRKTKFLIRMQPHVRTIPCKTWQALIALSTSPDAFKDDALFCFAGLLLLSSFSYILLVPRSCCFVVWCRHRLPETHPLAHSIAVAPKALLAARCACWRINNPNNVSLIYEV